MFREVSRAPESVSLGSMFDPVHDARVRAATFAWLADQVARHGEVLPHGILAEGFILDGVRVPLVGPQGIFKPQVLSGAPLSITTAPSSPYDDKFEPGRWLQYRYRGTDPDHADNRGLRFAMERQLPLVYFYGIARGRYLATWPVYITGDDPAGLVFSVAVDDVVSSVTQQTGSSVVHEDDTLRRAYVTAVAKKRQHQEKFRERVLAAYQRQCAFCRFRHEELLNAAHIIPDSEPDGEPHVRNGLALCTLHHSAFDAYFIAVRPDFKIEVRADILREKDGPTLLHGIQGLHGSTIVLPRSKTMQPGRELLERRYERFRNADL